MQYSQLRLFKPISDIRIPSGGIDGKNICFLFFPENNNFFDCYRFLNIPPKYVKDIFIPYTKRPIATRLTSDYRKKIVEYKLRPTTDVIGSGYDNLIGKNFFFDSTPYLSRVNSQFNITRYNSGRGSSLITNITEWLSTVSEGMFKRVLLYTVNLNNSIPEKFNRRRIYPIYEIFKDNEKNDSNLSFDQILLFYYDYSGGKYALLFEKGNRRNSSSRFKNILKNIQNINTTQQIDSENSAVSKEVSDESDITLGLPEEKKDILQRSIDSFAMDNNELIDNETPETLAVQSLLYHTLGNQAKSKSLAQKVYVDFDEDQKKKLISKTLEKVVPKEKLKTNSTNLFVNSVNVSELNDYQNPKHLIELRKKEFNENLKSDVENVFRTLEKEKIPLKIINLNVKTISTPVSELLTTITQKFFVDLQDPEGRIHKVEVELPKMGEDGTFTVNGQKKALITQLVTYPIFFIKPYEGRFQSSYSSFLILSKRLKNTSYLQIFLANYKVPLIMLLAYKLGFRGASQLFDLHNYEVVNKKEENTIKLPNGKYLKFNIDNLSDVQEDIIQSIVKSIPDLPGDMVDIEDKDVWREALIHNIGNRSSIFYIDKIWENVVTPIEVGILDTRNDPTTLPGIIKYMSTEVSSGRVDDRNDLHRLRIRSSELFTAQLQKQVKAAYSEYLSKRLGGDEETKLFINSKKVSSEIITSQNVQMFESINPLEELSMMTRITPVGIGGLATPEAIPDKARNIHYSYYGNIDPLETPDSATVGVQQHLSVGATVTNNRGMFSVQEQDNVKPSGILSSASSVVPFINHDEGARVVMAVGQSKQAFPLKYNEPPAVQTGYESILTSLLSDNFIKKSPVNGRIEEIGETHISIKDREGKIHHIDTSPKVLKSGQGKDGLSIFNPIILIGSIVKSGDIIAEGANVKEGTISNGINALAAFMPWKGLNFEDGMVVSKSLASKLVSLHREEYEYILTDEDDIVKMANEGDRVEKGDILISYSNKIYDVETYDNKRSEVDGIVSFIEIYNNRKDESVPEAIKNQYDTFVKKFSRIKGKYPVGQFKQKAEKFEGVLIKFTIKQELMLESGDKINNRHYNKGVISVIQDDENMPSLPDGRRVDIVYNPISVINRMNPGQLLEMHTGMIAFKLAEIMRESTRNVFEKKLEKILNLLDTSQGKRYSNSLLLKIKSLSDTKYSELKNKVIRDGYIPIIVPPFKSPDIKTIIKAMDSIGLKTSYPLKIKIDDEVITTKPVGVGILYIIKLEHLSSKKIHSRGVGPYISKTMTPTSGKKRTGAAMIGEYDFYSLLAYDTPTLVNEFFGALSSDHISKNEQISEIIRTGETTYKEPKNNPVRDLFIQMMHAIHLESN